MLRRTIKAVFSILLAFGGVVIANDFTKPEPSSASRIVFDSQICGNRENSVSITAASDFEIGLPWGCGLAHFENTSSETHAYKNLGEPLKNDWFLSFLEFDQAGNQKNPEQLKFLKSHLESQQSNFTIIYVHGWRHNANKNDEDVQDFRKLISYSKSFLNYRCEIENRYCGTTVTGVYIGWPGSTTWIDGDSSLASAVVSFTLPFRKLASEAISKKVVATIDEIELSTKQTKFPGAEELNKLLIIGHSLGGNLLISTLGERASNAVKKHDAGSLATPLLGDLTVLINPAAEASKWTAIQRAYREHPDIKLSVSDRVEGLNRLDFYPRVQPPLLMSITSACDFPMWFVDSPGNSDLKVSGKVKTFDCDTATGALFPILKQLTSFDTSSETRKTIGHLVPRLTQYSEMFGVTHELEIDRRSTSGRKSTTFENAVSRQLSICEPVHGWLFRARERLKECEGSPSGVQWDSGYKRDDSKCKRRLTILNSELEIIAQFRHGIFRNIDRGRQGETTIWTTEIVGPNDPYWNVRAMDNAVSGHNGYVSYPTWCAINQLVLDDVSNLH